ncbi:MAG: cyclic nucleotide-binding domain-containing protein [Arenicellales bacterium]
MTANRTVTGEPQRLRALIPLESLSAEGFERVANAMSLQRVKAGTMLFRLGKQNDYSLYLLDGCVELADAHTEELVDAGSDRARRALVHVRPNEFTGTALTDCIVAVIDSALLEKHLAWDQITRDQMARDQTATRQRTGRPVDGYEVKEFEGTADIDWMMQMLETPVFMHLPTANIQSLFSRFEELSVTQGLVVVRQGDPGDYYYIIRQGRAGVTRHTGTDTAESTLAELGPRDAFGEEALLSDNPRNATVTMLTDGLLMRLSKEDFRSLMTEPLIKRVDEAQTVAMIRAGALVLDVRLESEFLQGSIQGARNLPLYLLRLKAPSLDPALRYVVVCDTGARSAAAAFLLSERGLDVSLLEGGLASLGARDDEH